MEQTTSDSVLDAVIVPVVLAVAACATTIVDASIEVVVAVEEPKGLRVLLVIVLPPALLKAWQPPQAPSSPLGPCQELEVFYKVSTN